MVSIVDVPFRMLADPLTLRRHGRSRWIERRPASDILESM